VPFLTPSELMTLGGMIVTALSAFIAVREQVKGMQGSMSEILRQVAAIHKRMDQQSERISRAERDHAVLEERVSNLRASQRFKLPDVLQQEHE